MEFQKPTNEELHEFLMLKFVEYQMEQQLKVSNAENVKAIEQWEKRLREVTPEIFTKYLEEKGASHKCSLCGEESLSVPEGMTVNPNLKPEHYANMSIDERSKVFEANLVSYVQWTNLGSNTLFDLKSRTYYMMNCLNCGNLTLIRCRYVLDWNRANGKEDA
ncbi:hypothetical protein QYE92_03500 [Enterobacter cloacae subsp. cloacae]|uniref:hypothetical protein n=1 Tax=Enterobacter cloacae TaxID=550 RepID=UPI0011E6B50F|nr:hypothetical protein [Enterobacter cloacae]ELV2770953.1 hypothetical protein [Enterobacter cloacae]ELV2780042.1 hypothetical protein [Enterobacter cloacae]MCK7175577.1 hypothetical protein [Enterobacter cloacae]MCU6411621.1 hypothetical protein [Enterobacter cloacae]MDR9969553.1 hypothetical protein [Enterobacter cloacae subsp. cloacae]